MKRLGLVMLAVALCVVAARPVMAQGSLRYGINAGLLMPVSDYNTLDKMGWIAGAGATYWLPGNVGVRGDVSYSTTSHKGTGGGSTKKKTAAVRIEKTTLRAKTRISPSSRHRKVAMKKKRSIDMYGTISSGT